MNYTVHTAHYQLSAYLPTCTSLVHTRKRDCCVLWPQFWRCIGGRPIVAKQQIATLISLRVSSGHYRQQQQLALASSLPSTH